MKGRHGPGFILGLHLPLEDAMGFILVVTLLVLGLGIGAVYCRSWPSGANSRGHSGEWRKQSRRRTSTAQVARLTR